MNKNKSIKVILDQMEYNKITIEAKRQGISLQKFAKTRLLDDQGGRQELQDKIMRAVPKIYFLTQQADDAIREELFRIGEELCQF